jgi:hypothetical protein
LPTRTVHHGDAIPWLRDQALGGCSIVTSLPDVSELPQLGLDGWMRWFEDAAALVLERTPDQAVAIFYQSDVRHAGRWIDKGQLVARAAERSRASLLFHKIVCRKPAGTLTRGRASYSHMLAFSRALRPSLRWATPDVLPEAGAMPTPKSMGVLACVDACRFILAETATRTVVDPFCGAGTVLAVANSLGLDAIGVDLSIRQARRARSLTIELDAPLGPDDPTGPAVTA